MAIHRQPVAKERRCIMAGANTGDRTPSRNLGSGLYEPGRKRRSQQPEPDESEEQPSEVNRTSL